MMARAVVLVFLGAASVGWAQAPSACPWLAEGSAAKALGGDVRVSAQQQSPFAGACRFTLKGDADAMLDIEIGKTAAHACVESGAKLIGLGNEATLCHGKGAHGEPTKVIAGRVRDTYFIVTMSRRMAPLIAGMQSSSKASGSSIERVAEQVVGNLY